MTGGEPSKFWGMVNDLMFRTGWEYKEDKKMDEGHEESQEKGQSALVAIDNYKNENGGRIILGGCHPNKKVFDKDGICIKPNESEDPNWNKLYYYYDT